MDVIAGHVNPDFDCFASMVAAKKLYCEAKMVYLGSQNRNVREFYALHGEVLDFVDLRSLDQGEVSRLIMVDTRIPERLGELCDLARRKGVSVFTFDHHPPTNEDVHATRDFSRETGATTTILVEAIRRRQLAITPLEATLFAMGIHEDTGSLTYPTTTSADADALAYLMSSGVNVDVVDRFLSRGMVTDQLKEMLTQFLDSARHVDIHGVDVLIVNAKAEEYVDGVAMLPNRLTAMLDVEVVFALIEMGDRVHIIGRSKSADVNAGEVLAAFEGGGHPQAASAKVKDVGARTVEKRLVEELEAHVRAPVKARDIMSAPVVDIQERTKISAANEIMIRYGYEGLPVVSGGHVVGMIGRRDVDKAVHHGLAHAPVKGFMSRRVVTITGNESLHEIQQLLSDESIGRLPVLRDGKTIGIVTRTDLLRAMHGREYVRGVATARQEERFDARHVMELARDLLPGEVQRVLRDIGEIAQKRGVRAYLVGGGVRDLLLGVANLDVDVVVEGDGIALAKQLVARVGGRVRAHAKFGTAVAVLPGDFHVDIASARREFYDRPAALPEVERSSIREDLARRDFSINSMAISLETPHRGELLDLFGGLPDLRSQKIRVLHNLSFVEDPTRIFRAVRFGRRYGFRMDAHTEELARQAIAMGMVDHLSDVRIREELVAILSEESAFSALMRLDDLGALQGIHPKITVGEDLGHIFGRADAVLRRLDVYFPSRPRRWIVLLMAMLRSLRRKEIRQWGARMRLRRGDIALLEQGVANAPRLLKRLSSHASMRPSTLYFLLHDLRPEALVYVEATATEDVQRRRIEHYLMDLKGSKPHMTGKDLAGLGLEPGAHFGEILHALQVAKLDGRVPSKHDEERFLLGQIEKWKST